MDKPAQQINVLDRLAYIGDSAMGALSFEPKHDLSDVIFNNKDDHSKNFSFMMDKAGRWSLSPVYDIAYNSGMNGYHQMDVAGEARHPIPPHLLKLAKLADIK